LGSSSLREMEFGLHSWHELRLKSRLLGGDLLLIRREVPCCLGKEQHSWIVQGVGELDVLGLARVRYLQSSYTERTLLGAGNFKRRYVWLGIAMNLARDGLPRMVW